MASKGRAQERGVGRVGRVWVAEGGEGAGRGEGETWVAAEGRDSGPVDWREGGMAGCGGKGAGSVGDACSPAQQLFPL